MAAADKVGPDPVLGVPGFSEADGWQPDVLGEPFRRLTLDLTPDTADEPGPTVATLIQGAKPSLSARLFGQLRDTDVLFIPGWSDHFFQREVAEFWRSRGARFLALEPRRTGRSLREGQTPGFFDRLETYDEEIERALTVLGHGSGAPKSKRRLIIFAHSQGGLVSSYWASRHPGRIDALILNSPWLELQTKEVGRLVLTPFVSLIGRLHPRTALGTVDPGFYVRSLSKEFYGEWEFDPRLRPERSYPVSAAWLQAIIRGHEAVAAGLGLTIPVMVLMSDKSTFSPVWNDRMMHSDIVLDVDAIAKRSLDLGDCTTIVRVAGALHDVFLSRKPVREAAFAQMDHWLRGYASPSMLPATPRSSADG